MESTRHDSSPQFVLLRAPTPDLHLHDGSRVALEEDLCIHIFGVSAGLVGVCVTVIGLLRVAFTLDKVNTLADDLLLIRANVPECLRALPQWVCWRLLTRNGKPTKIPFKAGTDSQASSTDPASWCSFEQALAACSCWPRVPTRFTRGWRGTKAVHRNASARRGGGDGGGGAAPAGRGA